MVFVSQTALPENDVTKEHLTWGEVVYLFGAKVTLPRGYRIEYRVVSQHPAADGGSRSAASRHWLRRPARWTRCSCQPAASPTANNGSTATVRALLANRSLLPSQRLAFGASRKE